MPLLFMEQSRVRGTLIMLRYTSRVIENVDGRNYFGRSQIKWNYNIEIKNFMFFCPVRCDIQHKPTKCTIF